MATRFLHKGLPIEASPYGDKAPFAVNENGLLTIRRGTPPAGAATGQVTTDPGEEVVAVLGQAVKALSAGVTLVQADQYTIFNFGTAAAVDIVLPAATKPCRFTFVQSVAPTTTQTHKISPAGTDGIGGIGGNGEVLSFVDGKELYFPDATGATVTIQSDGTADWYILAATGTFAKQA